MAPACGAAAFRGHRRAVSARCHLGIAGAGAWGIGDPELVDVGVFGTGGISLPGGPLAGPTQLFVEGRLFTEQFDDWRNNYAVLGGLRFNFKPHHRLRRR